MSHEVETGVFAREPAWHRIGTVVPNAMTAAEAITLGKLDWTVDKYPVFDQETEVTPDGVTTKFVEVPDRFFLKRSTDMQRLSIVSDIYKPFQNRQAFTFMDNLVDSGDAKYETAMSLRGGRVVALTMHVPMDVLIGGEDRHEAYLLLRTTHDGSGRISVYVVMIRVVCMNTLTWAIQGASHSWGVTHTANVEGKVSEARDQLGLTFKYAQAFKQEGNALLNVSVTDDEIVKLLEGAMKPKARRDDEIEAILENYRTSDTVANYRGTGWGFINALTEYQEHVKPNRSGEALLTRTLDGENAKMRTALKNRLLRV
jgi:phage/plasmid-like protein (TIGR03299 family)